MKTTISNCWKVLLAVAGIGFATSAWAIDHPKVGDVIPDVAVKTTEGKPLNLRAAVASQPAVIVFYRGGWCPYCSQHLSALKGIDQKLKDMGLQLLAISADQPAVVAEFARQKDLNYTLLSDHTMEAAQAFKITFEVPQAVVLKYKNSYGIDLEAASGKKHHLLPHPGIFIVDTEGVVQFAHVNVDYKVRLQPETILAAARKAKR